MKVIYKFPSRSRPDKFVKCLDNITLMARHNDYEIIASIDANDRTMNNPTILNLPKRFPHLKIVVGSSTSKISAMNRDVPDPSTWDVVIGTSDDMDFIMEGFDLQILKDIGDNKDCVVHYNDGFDHGIIISLPVMTSFYYKRFGYLYHPAYVSLFCDEELHFVAKGLDKLIFSEANIVKHNHPANGAGVMDKQLIYTQKFHSIDKTTFLKRQRKNFFIDKYKI